MPEQKIQGKFYPLQNSEWVEVCKNLTKSQISILYYLRSLDPYSNGINVKASSIAKELAISRKTVYQAVAVLESKKYLDLEDINYSVKVSAKGCLCDLQPTDTCDGFTTGTQVLPPGDTSYVQVTPVTPGLQDSPPGDTIYPQVTPVTPGLQPEPETQSQQASCDPKIIKTYSDFKDSLSQEERESFLEFGKKKAAELPKPPGLPLKWIEKNWEELRIQWEKSQGKVSAAQESKWENHPQREEWLEKICSLGFAAFICESGEMDKERKAFFEWADSKNIIWGASS